ncbi:MAG: rhodanese-like domain-containing protein [Candidatus Helarchaeales archaeon]
MYRDSINKEKLDQKGSEKKTKELKEILAECDLEYFGKSKHKVKPSELSSVPDILLLDVRSREEYASLSFPLGLHSNVQFVHIPIDELPDRVGELPLNKNIVVFCPSNFRSTLAYAYLKTLGYESVRILHGGYQGLTGILMPGHVYKHVSRQNKEQ